MKPVSTTLRYILIGSLAGGFFQPALAAPPIAHDDVYETVINDNLSVDAPGVLANDEDPDGDPLTAVLVADSMASGNLLLQPDGSFEYEPAPGFLGIDTFVYKANDGDADSNPAYIRFSVTTSSGAAHFLDEASYLNALTLLGYTPLREGFEDDAVWGHVRTTITGGQVTAPSVTRLDLSWMSNNETGEITTGEGPVRTGQWGFFALPHGNQSTAPECLIPGVCTDGWIGSASQTLVAIGGWIETNTPYAGLELIIDGDGANPVDFDGEILTTQHKFFGYIDPDGFTSFEFRETEGTSGDQKYIFADQFTFAYSLPISVDAPLVAMSVVRGNLQSGDVTSLTASDDDYVVVDAERVGSFEFLSTIIQARSPSASPAALNATLEIAGDAPGVSIWLRLRNLDNGAWDRVGLTRTETADSRSYFLSIPEPGAYIRIGDGQIHAQVLGRGKAARFPNGFQVRIDSFEVNVVP